MNEPRLVDLAEINPESLSSNTPVDYRFRYLDLSSVKRGRIDWRNVEEFRFGSAPSRARRKARRGDCLIGTVRPLQQSHAFIAEEDIELVASTGFAVVRARKGVAEPRFIYHCIMSGSLLKQMDRLAVGSGYPAVSERDIAKLIVPNIGLREQRRIAEILDALDARIRAVGAEQAKAKVAMEGLAQAMLPVKADPSKVGDEWKLLPMIDVVPLVEYGVSSPLAASGRGVPTLRMNNLVDGRIRLHEVKVSSEPVPPNLLLREGDVLFNRTNSLEHVGRTSMWRAELPVATFASYLVRLTPDTSQLLHAYLVRWLNRPVIQQRIRRYATPGVHQVNINPTNLRRTLMELPRDLGHQREIVAVLDEAENLVSQLQNERRRLEVLKQGLAEDLLSGRVRV